MMPQSLLAPSLGPLPTTHAHWNLETGQFSKGRPLHDPKMLESISNGRSTHLVTVWNPETGQFMTRRPVYKPLKPTNAATALESIFNTFEEAMADHQTISSQLREHAQAMSTAASPEQRLKAVEDLDRIDRLMVQQIDTLVHLSFDMQLLAYKSAAQIARDQANQAVGLLLGRGHADLSHQLREIRQTLAVPVVPDFGQYPRPGAVLDTLQGAAARVRGRAEEILRSRIPRPGLTVVPIHPAGQFLLNLLDQLYTSAMRVFRLNIKLQMMMITRWWFRRTKEMPNTSVWQGLRALEWRYRLKEALPDSSRSIPPVPVASVSVDEWVQQTFGGTGNKVSEPKVSQEKLNRYLPQRQILENSPARKL